MTCHEMKTKKKHTNDFDVSWACRHCPVIVAWWC